MKIGRQRVDAIVENAKLETVSRSSTWKSIPYNSDLTLVILNDGTEIKTFLNALEQ